MFLHSTPEALPVSEQVMIANYRTYASRLGELLSSIADDGVDSHMAALSNAVNGQAAAELRNLVELPARREQGAFFTTSAIRAKAIPTPPHDDAGEVVYFDPACGAGDLLIESAMRLPVFDSLGATVHHWGERLLGCDVEPIFVETARLRLFLAAVYRTEQATPGDIPRDAFPWVVVGDGRSQKSLASRSRHIVLNPPFGYVDVPEETSWAGGRVSEAAVFLIRVLEYAPKGVCITAILPDVLRSGTRYGKWRSLIESMMDISDTVVPHRDPETGPRHPFIWSRRLPLSGSFNPDGEWRRFSGRTFDPPFVAIRRTSRPGQKGRAGGVLVVGDRPVAVENHLLVATPKNGAESSCHNLMDVLADPRSRDWLDQQIRTRHLTVSAISRLPWLDDTADV